MISAPKGVLRLAVLRMLSESSMSGTDLAERVARETAGEWRPGPGSLYLILSELLRKGLIHELPKRGGNVRRYIISAKGKEEMGRMSASARDDVGKQLRLLGIFARMAGDRPLEESLAAAGAGLAERRGQGNA